MLKFVKGIFSSSAPAPESSDIKEEQEGEEAAEEALDSDAQDEAKTHEKDADANQAVLEEIAKTMEPPSLPNGTPGVSNGPVATSSAVKGSSGKKKNKAKATMNARQIKNQKKKEYKRKKRDALDSSVMDSSVVDSSVMGDDIEPRGMGRRTSSLEESFVSPDLSKNMAALFGDIPASQAAVEKAKRKMSKKAKKAAKKRLEEQAALTNGAASQFAQGPDPMDPETQDMTALLKEAQLAKAKEKKAKKAAKSAPVVESKSADPRRESQSDEVDVVEKVRNIKQQAVLSPQKPAQASNTATQDEQGSLPLHPPPTPALFSSSKPQEPSQLTAEDVAEAEAQIQSNAWSTGNINPEQEEDEEVEPIRPSKKALGKRKASTPIVKTNAKRRKSRDSREGSATLGQFGFVPSSSSQKNGVKEAPRNGSREASYEASVLGQEVRNMFRSQMMDERRSPEPEILANSFIAVNASQQRRPTPAFTPVNPRKRLAGVVIPTPTRSPYELPPSSQPHPEDEPELPQQATQSSMQSYPVPEPEPEAEAPQKTPASTDKRKRRLPTGDAESSQIISKVSKRRSKSEVTKEPAKSMTPKQSASKAKTPKSKTPKVPASSKATPGSKGGRLAPEDIESINNAVEFYRIQNDMREVDINALIQRDAKSNPEFWAYMLEEVPQLPQAKIANHCRRNFHNFEARGSWTEEADQDLKDAYERHPGKWKTIGQELNRFGEDCRDRWRNYLVCGDNLKRAPWTREEEEKLRDTIEELLRLVLEGEGREWEDLTASDQAKLDWLKVSEMMDGTRSRLQCQTKWKNIMEREDATTKDRVAKQPISETPWRLEQAEKIARNMKASEKLALLYLLRDSKAGKEGTIPWPSIQQELDVRGRRMAFRVCYRNMKLHVPGNKTMKLQEVVSTLIDLYEAASPKEPKGFGTFMAEELYNEMGRLKRSSRSASKEDAEDDEDEEEKGDDESNHAEKQPSTQKKKRTSTAKKDNGEGSSKPAPRLRLAKGRKAAMLSEMDHENDHTPVKIKTPKKLRSRMKVVDQKKSQETPPEPAESADDIGEAFQAVKSSQATGRSPRVAKKPIVGARTSRGGRKSEKFVYEIEEEEEVEPSRSNIYLGEGAEDDADDESVQPEKSMEQEEEVDQPVEEINEDEERGGRSDVDMDSPDREPEVAESDHNMEDAPPLNGRINSLDEAQNVDEDEDDDFPSENHNTESVDLDEASHITTSHEENGFPDETGIDVDDEQRGADSEDSDQESLDLTRVRRESIDGDVDIDMNGGGDEGSGSEYGTPRRKPSLPNGSSSKDATHTSYLGRSSRNRNPQPNGGLDIESDDDGGESDVDIPPKTTPKPYLKNRQDTGTQASVSDDQSSSGDDSDIPHTPKAKQNTVNMSQGRGMGMGTGMAAMSGMTRGMLRSGRLARGREGSVEL